MSSILYVDSVRPVDLVCEIFKVPKSFILKLAEEEGLEIKNVNGTEVVDVFQVLKAALVHADKNDRIGDTYRMFANFMLWNEKNGRTLDDLVSGFYTAYMKYVGPRYLGVPNLTIVDMKFHMSTVLRKMRKNGDVVKTFRPFCGSKRVVWLRKEYASEEDIKLDRAYCGKRYLFTIVDGKVVCTKYLHRSVREDEFKDLLNIAGYIRDLVGEAARKSMQ
jgi:hypothetical protein